MPESGLETSVPDWVIDYPQTLAIFQALGIDVSCGGKSLEYVCLQKGLHPETVLAKLRNVAETQNE